jgi:hypothetical protein
MEISLLSWKPMTPAQAKILRQQQDRSSKAAERITLALAHNGDLEASTLAFLAAVRGYRRIMQVATQTNEDGFFERPQ